MMRKDSGFTLTELAIVITIAGLIIGSIVAGQVMIRTSQINSVVNDLARYTQAVNDFHDKYQSFPGDMLNATSMWGTDPGGCPTITTGAGGTPWNPTPHKETCNGDGNGLIGQSGDLDNGGYVAAGPGAYEWYRAWQHLADAGFIEGTYTGIMGPASVNNAVLGKNVPAAKYPGTGYTMFYASYPTGSTDWWPMMNHVISYGTVQGTNWTYGPALTPAEAFAFDTKLDDGVPSTGRVITFRQSQLPNCDTTDVQTTAQYNTAYTSAACNFIYDMGF